MYDPIEARFTTSMSPTNSVPSIEPEVITNVCTRNERKKTKSSPATAIDLAHSVAAFGCGPSVFFGWSSSTTPSARPRSRPAAPAFLFAIYLLDVPIALRGVAPQLLPAIKKAIAKAAVFAVTYTAVYGWLAAYLWRKTRSRSRVID